MKYFLNKKMQKKGYYFMLDAIFASLLLVTGLLILGEYSVDRQDFSESEYFGQDLLTVLSTIKIHEFNESNKNNSFIVSEIGSGDISNQDNSILEQAGEYWAREEPEKSTLLLSGILEEISTDKNFEIIVSNAYRTDYKSVYNNSEIQDFESITATRRMVSGIEKGKPLTGSTGTAYLRKINNKKTSSYSYFGGFIGQGNISIFVSNLPDDLNSSKILEISMELDPSANFSLYINNNFCKTLNSTGTNLSAVSFNMTSCKNSIIPGDNNFTLNFDSPVSGNYVAGGYIKVTYYTNELNNFDGSNSMRYYFPYVNGLVNIYDSLYIPGELNTMNVYIHIKNNQTTSFNIGNTVIYDGAGSDNVQNIFINDSMLTSFPLFLDYSLFSNGTVPIRLSSINTSQVFVGQGGDADVVLITDLSGSMRDRIGSLLGTDGVIRACTDPLLFNNDTRRISLAKCLDKEFINIIMNYSGNRMWLVDFSENANFYYSPSTANLINRINTYSDAPSGGTCIACAVNMAYNLLNNYSNSTRDKYVIVMSDGIPTYCTGRYFSGGSWRCNETSVGTTNVFNPSSCDGSSADCNNNDCIGPSRNAIFAGNRTRLNLNATIHSIGFGPFASCNMATQTLGTIAYAGNGSFFASQNGSELQNIYRTLAEEITSVSQSSQTILISGSITTSTLYGDSYIELNYTPQASGLGANEIEITTNSGHFNTCNITYTFPSGPRIIDAKIGSYSGEHWTDTVIVNGITIFNLSIYGSEYTSFGDPYFVHIPINTLVSGPNNIYIRTADSPTNFTGCSKNTSIIYTMSINSTTSRSSVLSQSIGCNWYIEFEDGTYSNNSIPGSYSGTNTCEYSPNAIIYKDYDAYDVSVFSILEQLDFDGNGKVDINLNTEDLEVIVTTVESVPYLWGPSIVEMRVWR
ncbi:MAG: vWA domain-containing protein [Candidatus Woesearchaeota archaeon]